MDARLTLKRSKTILSFHLTNRHYTRGIMLRPRHATTPSIVRIASDFFFFFLWPLSLADKQRICQRTYHNVPKYNERLYSILMYKSYLYSGSAWYLMRPCLNMNTLL